MERVDNLRPTFTALYVIYRFKRPESHPLAASPWFRWTAFAAVTLFTVARNL